MSKKKKKKLAKKGGKKIKITGVKSAIPTTGVGYRS